MSASQQKPVDMEHLARYTGGERALNTEILRLFDTQISEMIGKLNSILEARDAKSWKTVNHTIKGAARGIGAFGMGDAAAAAEPIDPASDREHARAALRLLESEAVSIQAFIRSYLDNPA